MSFRRWSNSSLTTVGVCGHKFYLKHIKKDYRPSGVAAARGRAAHFVAKETHKRQMVELGTWEEDREIPKCEELPGSGKSLQEARDLAATEFDRLWKGNEVHLSKEELKEKDAIYAHNKDAATDFSALYVGDVAPPIIPTAVERKVIVEPKDLDITLTGYLDLVEDEEGNEYIRDLKTKEKAPFKDEAETSQQLTLYTLIRHKDVGHSPKGSRLVTLVRTPKAHEMTVNVQETTRSIDDLKRMVERIRNAVRAVEAGVFVPAAEGVPGSPCGWCEFNDGTCEYVRRRGK